MKKLICSLLIVFSLTISLVFTGCSEDRGDGNGGGDGNNDLDLGEIAQCITHEGVKFYGAIWCGHCKKQKEKFGEAMAYIDYVECDPNTNLETAKICVEKGIEGVPTWEFPDGTFSTGVLEPEEIAKRVGCL